MVQGIYVITENKELVPKVFRMKLKGKTDAITAPGQFVNILLEGFYLRRPISVCDVCGDELTLIYKVVGQGTDKMSHMLCGEKLNLLTGLGNGYDVKQAGETPLLIGGGVGVPPMYKLCRELTAAGKKVTVILGFNSSSEVFYENEFKALGANVIVTTVDGSQGVKGFVTDAMKDLEYTYFYCCGSEPMLKAVYKVSKTEGEFSFERRMGCGFGACMGCSCKTITGNKRICKEGPVMKKGDILWED